MVYNEHRPGNGPVSKERVYREDIMLFPASYGIVQGHDNPRKGESHGGKNKG
jgi:hypothetical protein